MLSLYSFTSLRFSPPCRFGARYRSLLGSFSVVFGSARAPLFLLCLCRPFSGVFGSFPVAFGVVFCCFRVPNLASKSGLEWQTGRHAEFEILRADIFLESWCVWTHFWNPKLPKTIENLSSICGFSLSSRVCSCTMG